MQHSSNEVDVRCESEPMNRIRFSLLGAELPSHAGLLINMLCDDPTDPEMVEIEPFIESVRGRH